jgi:membrane protein
LGKWPALLFAIGVMIAIIYRYGPSRETAQWRWLTWGSAFAAIGWLAVSVVFPWYAAHFGSYNKTYGSVGAVIGLMTWMWLSSIVILLGAELDAEMEHQTARDTTTGFPKPMEARRHSWSVPERVTPAGPMVFKSGRAGHDGSARSPSAGVRFAG